MMTGKQNTFYFGLWGRLKKAQPGADRKAVHAQLGLPASHTQWTDVHFDQWKRHVLAVTQPANYRAQVAQVKMPATRKLTFLRHLLAALGKNESYLQTIVDRQQLGTPLAALDALPPEGLKKTMIALKKACRRRWATKELLLGEIATVRLENEFDEEKTTVKIARALSWPEGSAVILSEMVYEDLLVALSVMRALAGDAPAVGVAEEMHKAEIDRPF